MELRLTVQYRVRIVYSEDSPEYSIDQMKHQAINSLLEICSHIKSEGLPISKTSPKKVELTLDDIFTGVEVIHEEYYIECNACTPPTTN